VWRIPGALLAGLALGSVSPRAGAQLLECNTASVAELASSMATHNEHVAALDTGAAESLRADLRAALGVRGEGANGRPVPKRGVVMARPAGALPVLEPIVDRLSRLLLPDPIADALLWESIETCRRSARSTSGSAGRRSGVCDQASVGAS